jgi:hypothetical protein
VKVSGELDVWYQPELTDARAYYDRRNRAGGSAAVHARVDLAWGLGLYGKLGYKTEGYLPAQPLGAGIVGFAGVSLREP